MEDRNLTHGLEKRRSYYNIEKGDLQIIMLKLYNHICNQPCEQNYYKIVKKLFNNNVTTGMGLQLNQSHSTMT